MRVATIAAVWLDAPLTFRTLFVISAVGFIALTVIVLVIAVIGAVVEHLTGPR